MEVIAKHRISWSLPYQLFVEEDYSIAQASVDDLYAIVVVPGSKSTGLVKTEAA